MTIAILGAGNVGTALGRAFAARGESVYFGVPNPVKYAALASSLPNARVGIVADAVREAQIVVLATPFAAAQEALRQAGALDGKILIDCTNPLKPDLSGLLTGPEESGAERIAAWARGARVVKAFNTTGAENMTNPAYRNGQALMLVCGDDEAARLQVVALAARIGFDAVDAGSLAIARLLEPLAMLWIHLAFRAGLGRDFAFGMLRR